MRKSAKKVEFSQESFNDRSFDTSLLLSNNNNPTSISNLNYGTNRSIRRVADLSTTDINLPDFKLNLQSNTDDLLQQLKANLTQL